MKNLFYVLLFLVANCPNNIQKNYLSKPKEENKTLKVQKDTITNTSFFADELFITDSAKFLIKGKYTVTGKGKPIDTVKIKKLTIKNEGWLAIQSLDTYVIIDSIFLENGKFTVTTEAKDFDNGTTLNIKSICINNSNNSPLFFQNIKGGYINQIVVDSTMWKNGKDMAYRRYGFQALKWDNALSDTIDKRKFHIKKYITKNTNFKDFVPQANLKALWLDEGTNNVTIDSLLVDMQVDITPCNEYCPPSTGNHHFKYVKLTNKKPYMMNKFLNSRIDYLENESYLLLKNMQVSKIKGKIHIAKKTNIKQRIE